MNRTYMITGSIVLGVSGWVMWASRRYTYMTKSGPGPGFFPMGLGFLLALLAIMLIIDSARGVGRVCTVPSFRGGARGVTVVLAALITFTLGMSIVGFRLATVAFTFVLLCVFGKYHWLTHLGISIGAAQFLWVVFRVWLTVPLPRGLFGF